MWNYKPLMVIPYDLSEIYNSLPMLLWLQERRYVHFFFDKFSGNWMRLPIGWELHHPLIQNMVQHVEVLCISLSTKTL